MFSFEASAVLPAGPKWRNKMSDFNLFPPALKAASFALASLVLALVATPFLLVGAQIVA